MGDYDRVTEMEQTTCSTGDGWVSLHQMAGSKREDGHGSHCPVHGTHEHPVQSPSKFATPALATGGSGPGPIAAPIAPLALQAPGAICHLIKMFLCKASVLGKFGWCSVEPHPIHPPLTPFPSNHLIRNFNVTRCLSSFGRLGPRVLWCLSYYFPMILQEFDRNHRRNFLVIESASQC